MFNDLERLEEDSINVAVAPLFARLERFNDRVFCRMKVLRRVLVLRRVAATDVTARFAQAQMHPRIAHLQTFFTTLGARHNISNLI